MSGASLMSEGGFSSTFGPAPTAPAPLDAQPPAPVTAGAMLRYLRESAGVDVALLASAMKVSLQKLQALESDRLEGLPDVTFARGLAASICRAFGTDPAPVLERMPTAPELRTPSVSLNQPFRRGSDGPEPILRSKGSRPWLLAVFVLLLGAALLWLWPTLPIRVGEPEFMAPDAADAPPSAIAEPVAPPAVLSEAAPEEAPAEEPVLSVPAEAAPADASPESLESPESPAAEAAGGGAAEAPAAPALLAIQATGESWVSVTDRDGKTLLNRTLAANERVSLSGELPLSVTVGRKEAVQVTVRGQALDIASSGKSSVARFKVE